LLAARDAGHAQLERPHVGQDATRVGEEQAARVGQRNALGVTLEQREAELGLERADLQRQRRLLDAEHRCGAGHVTRVGDGLEVAQVSKLHVQNSICRTYRDRVVSIFDVGRWQA